MPMLRHHLKFSTRVFMRDKFFAVLNILGLSLGIAVSIILLLILQNDLTYDKHFENHENIYRLGAHETATGLDIRVARSARELGKILQEEFPEVKTFVRANTLGQVIVKYEGKDNEEKVFKEENIARTDSNYFEVFSHEFIAGDPKTCLTDANTLVMTGSTAKRYFGNDDPIDKSLLVDGQLYKVTGVIEDIPENTHLKFDFLLSALIDREWVIQDGQVKSEAFWNPDVYLYLVFPDHYNVQDFYDKFPDIYSKYFKSFGDQVGGAYTPILEPLASIHFHSDLEADEPQGNLAYLYAFTGIGLFIIILACINYMNLSTAKSVNRAAEIAMKKTLGSSRASLVLSFLGESIFLAFIALVLAIALVFIVLKATSFNSLIERNLDPDFVNNPVLLLGTIGLTFTIGLVSGLYPALYLPAIPAIKALKGAFKNQHSSLMLRKVLTTTQFAISIFVVVCTLFMQQQIDYMRNKQLGFDKENTVILPIQDTLVQNQIKSIKHEFMQHPSIVGATTSYHVPGLNVGGGPVMWAEGDNGMQQQKFTMMWVDEDYIKTMNIELLSGRDFNPGEADNDQIFIANEAAVKLMGWNDKAIGKKVKFFHAEKDGQVVGVVKDFNFSSLHNPVEPLLIGKSSEEGGFLYLKVKGENLHETMDYIERLWKKYDPNNPYEFFFLDQRFNEQYKEDEVQYKLLSNLSYICIFISLLGLLGLSAFTASQRTKEIGIRKVHGAGVPNIIYLLYKDVMYLIIVASVVVVPIVYYVIDLWLGNFAYQTSLNYLIFLAVGVMALIFTFLTVVFHSMKTATTNPVEALKYE